MSLRLDQFDTIARRPPLRSASPFREGWKIMLTRAELEAALAKAEADIREARDDLDRALPELAKANADWEKVADHRRKAGADRRKEGSMWDHAVADRRKVDADRRDSEPDRDGADASLAVLIKVVAERDRAFKARMQAAADCADAEARRNVAVARRGQAAVALHRLNSEDKNR
jgi:hypothetical protein